MKKYVINVLTHKEPKNSYWDNAVLNGINDAVREYQCELKMIDIENADNFNGEPILIAGGRHDWACKVVPLAASKGAKPIVVNSVDFGFKNLQYSSVVFEYETVIDKCIKCLKIAGRTKTVLLGVGRRSVVDKLKCDAFANRGDVYFSDGSIEECIDDFLVEIDKNDYDSIICANDTFAVLLEQKLLKMGYKIPENIFVIGMGNSLVGQSIEIPLTSITLDYYTLGKMSVSLYRYIADCNIGCQINVKLPCQLQVRESAPFDDDIVDVSPLFEETVNFEKYFGGDAVQNIINVEALMQECEKTDLKILLGLCYGKSCEEISEELYLSARAVRYRIANLVKKYNFKDRKELENSIKKAILTDFQKE